MSKTIAKHVLKEKGFIAGPLVDAAELTSQRALKLLQLPDR